MRVPVLLHVITQKGRGYTMAELHPDKYHGVGPYDPVTGVLKKAGRPSPAYSGVSWSCWPVQTAASRR